MKQRMGIFLSGDNILEGLDNLKSIIFGANSYQSSYLIKKDIMIHLPTKMLQCKKEAKIPCCYVSLKSENPEQCLEIAVIQYYSIVLVHENHMRTVPCSLILLLEVALPSKIKHLQFAFSSLRQAFVEKKTRSISEVQIVRMPLTY